MELSIENIEKVIEKTIKERNSAIIEKLEDNLYRIKLDDTCVICSNSFLDEINNAILSDIKNKV